MSAQTFGPDSTCVRSNSATKISKRKFLRLRFNLVFVRFYVKYKYVHASVSWGKEEIKQHLV